MNCNIERFSKQYKENYVPSILFLISKVTENIKIISPLLLIALLGLTLESAHAQTVRVDAKSGQAKVIGHIALIAQAGCADMLPRRPVKSKAEHGKVATRRIRHTFDKGVCKGETVDVVVISYRPNVGFSGKDTVTVNYWGRRNRFTDAHSPILRTKKFLVTVK